MKIEEMKTNKWNVLFGGLLIMAIICITLNANVIADNNIVMRSLNDVFEGTNWSEFRARVYQHIGRAVEKDREHDLQIILLNRRLDELDKKIERKGGGTRESEVEVISIQKGDINRDGKIDSADYDIINWWYNEAVECNIGNNKCGGSDLNDDGAVDANDYDIIDKNFLLEQ